MKTFDQLTPAEQKLAHSLALEGLLYDLFQGNITVADEAVQARAAVAARLAKKRGETHLAGKYIYEACKVELDAIVEKILADCQFSEPNDPMIMDGIVGMVRDTGQPLH
jgi:hypothetical protein